jgi:hypothetical protein
VSKAVYGVKALQLPWQPPMFSLIEALPELNDGDIACILNLHAFASLHISSRV